MVSEAYVPDPAPENEPAPPPAGLMGVASADDISTDPVVPPKQIAKEFAADDGVCIVCGELIVLRCESRPDWCARDCPHDACNARADAEE